MEKKMKKKENGFNVKRYVIASGIIICMIIGINTLLFAISNAKTNIRTATNQREEPKAITVNARTPNTNNFHYEESLETGTNGEKIKVPVPTGYVGKCIDEESYVNGVTSNDVREHHGGYVIYEKNTGETDEQARTAIQADIVTAQKTRNQWVWVPIEDVEDMYHVSENLIYANKYNFSATDTSYAKNESALNEPVLNRYNSSNELNRFDYDHKYLKQYMEGISRSELLLEMREEFYEMLESVKTYGGFYIGRYETGNVRQNNVKIVKGQTSTMSDGKANNQISDITWYKAYLKSRSLRGSNPVHTGIIWGIQWDETLLWLIKSGEKTAAEVISDSSGWGNYPIATFTYKNTSGSVVTKNSGSKTIIPTGSSEYTKANNIYDLAGNVYEWTMECDTAREDDARNCRGGSYNYDDWDWSMYRYSAFPQLSSHYFRL